MNEHSYIFLTLEGYTYQPGSEATVPDIENVQMLGIAAGTNQEDAFRRLVVDNPWLLETSFSDVHCYELAYGFEGSRAEFCLEEERNRGTTRKP